MVVTFADQTFHNPRRVTVSTDKDYLKVVVDDGVNDPQEFLYEQSLNTIVLMEE